MMKKVLLLCFTAALSAGVLALAYLCSAPTLAAAPAPEAEAPERPAAAEPSYPPASEPELLGAGGLPEEEEPLPSPIYTFENYIFLGDSMIFGPKEVIVSHGHQVLAGVGASVQSLSGVSTAYRTLGVQEMATMTGTLRDGGFNGIVILMGANDVVGDYGTAGSAMEKYRTVLEELRGAFDVPVFVLKVFPTGPSYRYWDRAAVLERTADLNGLLEAYCAETEGVYFLDATGDFTDENGDLVHDLGDGLHISPEYYEQFYGGVEAALYATGLFYQNAQ